jgi:hypothetical protein
MVAGIRPRRPSAIPDAASCRPRRFRSTPRLSSQRPQCPGPKRAAARRRHGVGVVVVLAGLMVDPATSPSKSEQLLFKRGHVEQHRTGRGRRTRFIQERVLRGSRIPHRRLATSPPRTEAPLPPQREREQQVARRNCDVLRPASHVGDRTTVHTPGQGCPPQSRSRLRIQSIEIPV